jgi:hypothetical protein
MDVNIDLVRANLLEVFGERDPARRLSAIKRLHAPHVVFTDPEGSVTGHQALDAKARGILASSPPDFVFRAVGSAYSSGDIAYVRWSLGPDGGPPAVTGTDVVIVSDGRINKLYTMLTND